MIEKYQLMWTEKANHTIALMARLLTVSRSGYYAWTQRRDTPPPATLRRDQIREQVKASHDNSNGVNGLRRIRAELAAAGVHTSEGAVRARMAELGIFGVQPRTSKRTTIAADDAEQRPDLIRRDFTTGGTPGARLVGDITYLRTSEGWLYLATVIDLATRMVIGWSMAEHMRTTLICDALSMAHQHGHVAPGAIFHSDRGSQYTSVEYTALAACLDVRLSVGRTGSCHDNAVAESWFSMLKNEMYHRTKFATRARARFAVMQYIEVFYNRRRLHSSLGYQTPATAWTEYQTRQTATAA